MQFLRHVPPSILENPWDIFLLTQRCCLRFLSGKKVRARVTDLAKLPQISPYRNIRLRAILKMWYFESSDPETFNRHFQQTEVLWPCQICMFLFISMMYTSYYLTTACSYNHRISAFIQSWCVYPLLTWCPCTVNTQQAITACIHFLSSRHDVLE